jgi:hypothetical protein
MSLIFNFDALEGLPDEALKSLRGEVLAALATDAHSDAERFNLLQMLNRIEMLLRRRKLEPPMEPMP